MIHELTIDSIITDIPVFNLPQNYQAPLIHKTFKHQYFSYPSMLKELKICDK